MVKIIRAEHLGGTRIRLAFSTQEVGIFDIASLIARGGSMVEPLQNEGFLRDFFLELGALCWRNGFELSPRALYEELKAAGLLETGRAA